MEEEREKKLQEREGKKKAPGDFQEQKMPKSGFQNSVFEFSTRLKTMWRKRVNSFYTDSYYDKDQLVKRTLIIYTLNTFMNSNITLARYKLKKWHPLK